MIFIIPKDIKFSYYYKKLNLLSLIFVIFSLLIIMFKGLNLSFKGGETSPPTPLHGVGGP